MKKYTAEEILKMKFTGYVRGEYFSGEWLDGSSMCGYPIYYVEDGVIDEYGEFSETGEPTDCEYAGDLCMRHYCTWFEIIEGEAEQPA